MRGRFILQTPIRADDGALDNEDTQPMDAVDHRQAVFAAGIGVVDEHRGGDEAHPHEQRRR